MKGKDLNKRVKDFSRKTNFYKLGLIKKYLKKQIQEEQELIDAIPKVICPKCGSKRISVESSDSEYSSESWLYCNDCEEDFNDTFGYIDAVNQLDGFAWCDVISLELHFEEPNIKSYKWQEFCELEIKKYLGIIQNEPLSF